MIRHAPRIDDLIVRREPRFLGELRKLGYRPSRQTVKNILVDKPYVRNRETPTPEQI